MINARPSKFTRHWCCCLQLPSTNACLPVCLSLALIRLPMCSLCAMGDTDRQKCRQKKSQTVGDSRAQHTNCRPLFMARLLTTESHHHRANRFICIFFPFLSFASPLSLRIFLLLMLARVLQFTLLFFHLMLDFFYFYPFSATHFVAWMLLLLSMLLTIFYFCIFFPFWLHHFGLFDHCRTESWFQIIRLTKICRDFSFETHSVDSAVHIFFCLGQLTFYLIDSSWLIVLMIISIGVLTIFKSTTIAFLFDKRRLNTRVQCLSPTPIDYNQIEMGMLGASLWVN